MYIYIYCCGATDCDTSLAHILACMGPPTLLQVVHPVAKGSGGLQQTKWAKFVKPCGPLGRRLRLAAPCVGIDGAGETLFMGSVEFDTFNVYDLEQGYAAFRVGAVSPRSPRFPGGMLYYRLRKGHQGVLPRQSNACRSRLWRRSSKACRRLWRGCSNADCREEGYDKNPRVSLS